MDKEALIEVFDALLECKLILESYPVDFYLSVTDEGFTLQFDSEFESEVW